LLKYEKASYKFIGLFTTNLHIKLDIPSYNNLFVIATKQKADYVSGGHHVVALSSKIITFITVT
jgi:hypothetical protein